MFILFYLFIFRERDKEGERERGKETLVCERYIDRLPLARPQGGTLLGTQACALTGNQTGHLSVLRLALNTLSHTSQGPNEFLTMAIPNPSAVNIYSRFHGAL